MKSGVKLLGSFDKISLRKRGEYSGREEECNVKVPEIPDCILIVLCAVLPTLTFGGISRSFTRFLCKAMTRIGVRDGGEN